MNIRVAPKTDIANAYKETFKRRAPQEFRLMEYLEECRTNPYLYAGPHERWIKGLGEPVLVDTSKDQRLNLIFYGKTLRTYPEAFSDFFGFELVAEEIVSFMKRGAQGLDEARKIIYLLGPAGGGKSSVMRRCREIMEREPFHVLAVEYEDEKTGKAVTEYSPVFESPLGLFAEAHTRPLLDNFQINPGSIPTVMSGWAKRWSGVFEGDIERFKVVRIYPSLLGKVGIAIVDPGDEQTQDITTLVGKTNIRKVGRYSQDDPRSYSYSGGLNVSNQGFMEFREMFKAPIKTLNPMLFAQQDGNYEPSEKIGPLPFFGIIGAHSNEAEWDAFKGKRENEAFIDRVGLIKVPYCLRVQEEIRIYEKMIWNSRIADTDIAPGTLKALASFSVLTRLEPPPKDSTWEAKLRVYDGENIKKSTPKALMYHQYKEKASPDEGMSGFSTRRAFEIISKAMNNDPVVVSADPVTLLALLVQEIIRTKHPSKDQYLGTFIKEIMERDLYRFIDKEVREALFDSLEEWGQTLFENYAQYAEHWLDETDYRMVSGTVLDRSALNGKLEEIEKPAGIANPKDFRDEVVRFSLKYRAQHNDTYPSWKAYERFREVIEKKLVADTQDILPIVSFSAKSKEDESKRHGKFLERMQEKGWTLHQIKIIVDWYTTKKESKK